MLELVKIILLGLLVYLCIYNIVNRICDCVEHVAITTSYRRYMNDIEKELEKEKELNSEPTK